MVRHTLIIGSRSNLSRALASGIPHATLVASDALDTLPDLWAKWGECDIIYNTYQKSSLLCQTDAPETYANYALGKLATFVALCLEHPARVRTVIFTSSSAVYGDNAHAAESDKTDIKNLYASLKLASEFFLKDHLSHTPIRLIFPRVFNMYGGEDEFSVVSKIAAASISGREITVANKGRSVRDFIHINDVVAIYQKLLRSSTAQGVVNVGTGSGSSVAEVIQMAQAAFGRKLNIAHIIRDEIARSVAATDLLAQMIGPYTFRDIDSYYREYARAVNEEKAS